MQFQEKRALASLLGTVIISVFYFINVFQRYQTEQPASADEFRFWAAAILLYIPVSIVLKIVVHIVFIIINTVATQEKEPTITDEFDKLVDLKAIRNFYHVFMAGFLLALLTVAVGQPAFLMFALFLLAIIAAAVVLDASQFYFYRRGV
jgi:hypothetical protein